MIGKGQVGQALILVLMLLAVGSLLIVPGLGLLQTSFKSGQIIDQREREMYAAEAAQDYVMWELKYGGLGSAMSNDGDNVTVTVDVCGTIVDALIILRAQESKGPVVFATEHVIKPTVTVSPDTVPNDTWNYHTYTLRLEQLSPDTSQGLDAIYNVLPKGFDEEYYTPGSSEMRIDGGPWQSIPDPLIDTEASQLRLKWPADYKYQNGADAFSSDPLDVDRYFYGMRDFQVRQVKEIRFEIEGELGKNENHPSRVVLKPWDTISSSDGLITVGSPNPPFVRQDGMIQAYATTNPGVIQPGEVTDIEYTYSITNYDVETLSIMEVKCWLPPGFTYTPDTTSGITDINPQESLQDINGQERWYLYWEPDGTVSMASAETLPLTFWVETSQEVSGTFYTELMVIPNKPSPGILKKIGITEEEWVTNYSWNTGAVVVPHYDSQTNAGGVIIDTNLGLVPGGFAFMSWNIR